METVNEKKPLSFWKTILASATGFLIAFFAIKIIGLFLIISIVAGLVSANSSETATTISGDHIFLKIDLSNSIAERTPDKTTLMLNENKTMGLYDLIKAIDHAREDDRISGIYLQCDNATIDWAQCDELRDALNAYHEATGNPIVAYADNYTQTGYYLATVSDCIGLHPAGIVDIRGIGAEVIFYKDLFDKIGVHIELIRPSNNNYKSAGETYTRNSISEANREQIRSYAQSIWQHITQNIAQSRHTTPDNINQIADNLTGYEATRAHFNNIVDTLLFQQDIHNLLKKQYNCKCIVDITKYLHSYTNKPVDDKIAIIYAEGNVNDGTNESYTTAIYSDDIVDAINEAVKNKEIKAIVLRINSPGGSATASETITHAIIEATHQKPVIVSMSTLAASAGYEIASNATTIVAQPTTLTGSIGVFATIPEIGTLLKKKLGIGIDTINTNSNSTGITPTHPLSPTARNIMQNHVEKFYQTFIQRVATGRSMTTDAVDEIARGRVWTGQQALANGLVDTIGGITLALRIAAEKAGIEAYSTVDYPKEKDLLSRLIDIANEKEDIILKDRIEDIVPYYHDLVEWTTLSPIQARIPYIIHL